jgi:hypothetical protein
MRNGEKDEVGQGKGKKRFDVSAGSFPCDPIRLYFFEVRFSFKPVHDRRRC